MTESMTAHPDMREALVTDEMVLRACKANLHPLAEPSFTERMHMRRALEAALATPDAGEAWVLVPREPTAEMVNAGVDAGVKASPDPWCPKTWAAMLNAAPPPPSQKEGE